MNFVRALLACVYLLQLWAYEKLVNCCNSCLRRVSGLTSMLYAGFVTGLEPVRNLFIVVKAPWVLCWKFAFATCSVPWRLWDLLHICFTASCCILSRWSSLFRDIPYACLSLLCCICSQMREAVLQLLWFWTPGGIQTICTALCHYWWSTGTKGSDPAPPRRASFAFASFVISIIIQRALSRCLTLLRSIPCACLALLRHICSQLKEAALQMLWSWTPGWIQTTYTILAFLWHNTGKERPAAAPPATASFGFGDFIVTIVRRAKTSGVTPSPSGTAAAPQDPLDMHPAPARDTLCEDSSSHQHKSGVPSTQSAGTQGSQEATEVGCPLLALVGGLLVPFWQL